MQNSSEKRMGMLAVCTAGDGNQADADLNTDEKDQTLKEVVRNHRVGTITTGLAMIVYGVLFLLQTFTGCISFETIFKLWPCILIGLGIEVFASNFENRKLTYDKGAIVLLFVLNFFAMCMAAVQLGFIHYMR